MTLQRLTSDFIVWKPVYTEIKKYLHQYYSNYNIFKMFFLADCTSRSNLRSSKYDRGLS